MRKVILGSSEEDFIRSLAHCVPWQARGGKSGAAFYATEGKNLIICSILCTFRPHLDVWITLQRNSEEL